MLKKIRNHEKKFYEIIGIKTFRKMAFALVKFFSLPILILLSKEERKKFLSAPSNYNMKKGHGIKDLKDFKKMLFFNAAIHTWGLYKCIPNMQAILLGGLTLTQSFWAGLPVIINLYCIMLQRYNLIRIHEAEEKYEKYRELKEKRERRREEKEKEQIEVAMKKINELLSLFDRVNSSNDENLVQVVDSKAAVEENEEITPLNPDYWFNSAQPQVKVLSKIR